jgi:hypothetical protein
MNKIILLPQTGISRKSQYATFILLNTADGFKIMYEGSIDDNYSERKFQRNMLKMPWMLY